MSLLFDNMEYAILYVVIMNILGVAVMGIDKYKAQHKLWRIPEKTLFLVSILGGSIGTWAGMYLFRHKTKHWYFVFGMPAIYVFYSSGKMIFLYEILCIALPYKISYNRW